MCKVPGATEGVSSACSRDIKEIKAAWAEGPREESEQSGGVSGEQVSDQGFTDLAFHAERDGTISSYSKRIPGFCEKTQSQQATAKRGKPDKKLEQQCRQETVVGQAQVGGEELRRH